ncbi:streptogramin lyase [Novosphingobium sp. PhB165]|uniref:Vgb family protein n=1 Tax=Novosphingobium sp. PhB165 TaxID=2485105 RepID=UPI00104CA8ED|nr:YncE family protein [Novosphingobium sp. PhB165]TCM20570.1 streptogramin lyase [Novosphingobium sp. PhB165]
MRTFGLTVLAAAGAMATISTAAQAQQEQVITVPGFADFLAVDGKTVWATNKGRVERWSRESKLAEVAMAHPCGAMAIADGSLWVADCKEGTLNRIDIRTAKLTATIATGIANPKGELNVVAGAGSIWVASDAGGKIARVDPASNSVTASVTVDPGTWYLAFGFGSLWAVSAEQQSLQRIDPKTNSVVGKTPLGKEPGFLAAGSGGVWVQEQGDGTVARIDPHTGELSGRIKVGENLKWGDIDTGSGKVWLRTTDDQVFVVIDPKTMGVDKRMGKAAGSGALRYTHHGLWTTAHDEHTLTWWPKSALKGKSDAGS